MISRTETSRFDTRSNKRVRENKLVAWQVKGREQRGRGRIRNISTSGMLLESDRALMGHDDECLLWFDSSLGHNNYIPHNGRLVWHRQSNEKPNRYLCGIEFLKPADYVMPRLERRVKRADALTAKQSNLAVILDPMLVVSIVALMGFILWQSKEVYHGLNAANDRMSDISDKQAEVTRTYQNLYYETELKLKSVVEELNTTKKLYYESELKLTDVSRELEETKAILVETEAFLAKAKVDNSRLKGEIDSISQLSQKELEETKNSLNTTIAALKEKNRLLSEDVQLIESQLQYYEGNIKGIEDGESLVGFYRIKIKEVKTKIKDFKSEAEKVRVAALRERDRIQMLLGNNGYFVKDGQIVKVDTEKYNAAVLDNAGQPPPETVSDHKVQIDVSFVE